MDRQPAVMMHMRPEHLATPALRDVVLVGGGHSHAVVLRRLMMKPAPGVRLTLVCTDAHTPYSGMLPGFVAGHYSLDAVHIDLVRLCRAAGAVFVHDEVVGLDRDGQRVLLRHRPSLRYDLVSINTGSTPRTDELQADPGAIVPVKPISGFHRRWDALLARVLATPPAPDRPLRLAVVGGGAGGVELVLAIHHRLAGLLGTRAGPCLQIHLVTRSARVLPTHPGAVSRAFESVMRDRGIHLHVGHAVERVANGWLETRQGLRLELDEVIGSTQARGAAWLADTGLDLDASGFVRVRPTLQSLNDPRVFAAGDVAALEQPWIEKAGVFAVRQGPILADNLIRSLQGLPLRAYRPQRSWLALISTGDTQAIASKGALSLTLRPLRRPLWWLKDHIDRRFMDSFDAGLMHARTPATSTAAPVPIPALEDDEQRQWAAAQGMRCGGCGAKIGADVLSRALRRLSQPADEAVEIGLGAADDAAVMRMPPGSRLVHSVDFIRAFTPDAYLLGRIAAQHALGDLLAIGARPHSASAIVTLAPGTDAQQEELLYQLMAGALASLGEAHCPLVGGHSAEGAEMAIGFAVNGTLSPDQPPLLKSGLQAGDALVLTHPLGTGVLLAADQAARADGRWVQAALRQMASPKAGAAAVLRAHGATACTDVTGFGLSGHLGEMLLGSGLRCRLWPDRVPALEGALPLLQQGVRSSLHDANERSWHRRMSFSCTVEPSPGASGTAEPAFAADVRMALLHDPQTSGGLLAGIAPHRAADCLQALHEAGFLHACVIGQAEPVPPDASAPRASTA